MILQVRPVQAAGVGGRGQKLFSWKNVILFLIAGLLVFSGIAGYFILRPGEIGARGDGIGERVKNAVDGHVVPKLQTLASATTSLRDDVGHYCESGGDGAWAHLKVSFGQAVEAWAGVQHLRFGPVSLKARGQRMSFWPDPRGIVWRQLRPVLAARDQKLLIGGALGEQSVALQGLTALAPLLASRIPVGTDATEADVYRCQLATAIGRTILATSTEILNGWIGAGGWRERMLTPSPANAVYKSHQEAMGELLKSAMVGFQVVRDQQVAVVESAINGTGKLARLPYYRSGLSSRFLRANVRSSCDLVDRLDLLTFVPKDKSWLRAWIPNGCQILKEKSSAFQIPNSDAELAGAIDPTDLRQLKFYSNGLRQVLGRDIAPAAGLTIGFNDLDGD